MTAFLAGAFPAGALEAGALPAVEAGFFYIQSERKECQSNEMEGLWTRGWQKTNLGGGRLGGHCESKG